MLYTLIGRGKQSKLIKGQNMFLRKRKSSETQTELLHRRYANALTALSNFKTDAAFFAVADCPVDYADLCKQIDQLTRDFQENVFFGLPSARIIVK